MCLLNLAFFLPTNKDPLIIYYKTCVLAKILLFDIGAAIFPSQAAIKLQEQHLSVHVSAT